MRPPFLLLVVSCLTLSFGFVSYLNIDGSWLLFSLILVCGLCAHIAVNMLNEYVDCTSKLDFATNRTPFSGGSGALVSQPDVAHWVKYIGIGFVALTIASGLLVMRYAPQAWQSLFAMGVLGIVIVISYTPVLNRFPWLCLISPGLGFGVLMSYGSYVAVSGEHSLTMLLLALIPTLLTNNLLLLNQFPDAASDADHGRNHVLIQYGYLFSARLYLVQWLLTIAVVVATVAAFNLPLYALVCLLPMVPGWKIYQQAKHFSQPDEAFLAAMGQNVMMTLATPLLLGVALCVAG
ncbi:hypothetical protein BFC17_16460 [Alteromonas lipolytica]|uniref:Ubiquinone biosynthesis protein UbiA n=2 Tax=Alteromonas lipolytica TaxID=1856405 RepID=A0A1E8FHG4_9ALTE|nr:hypothetical protein BFC17_16460 [Alteromonas lipolytica]